MKIKKTIRMFSIWLSSVTSRWVVPLSVYELIDSDKFEEAKSELEKIKLVWGSDPEIVRAESIIQFLDG